MFDFDFSVLFYIGKYVTQNRFIIASFSWL
jgi:hypothetical protein